MKKIILTFVGLIILTNVYSQDKSIRITDEVKLTYKNLIEIRLQLLAAQISCGSHTIIDMGKVNFPVSIGFNDDNMILFEIEGDIKPEYSQAIHEEIITESFVFVEVSIKELFRRSFPEIDFDFSNGIIGYWYYKGSEGRIAQAIWQSSELTWIIY